MNTRIIDTADAVVRRYKTRNPEEIISQRAIKLKDIRCCRDLLGYYTVMLNCEYIHHHIVHQSANHSTDCVIENIR